MNIDYQGVYIHIPFCQKKCFYCDFPSYEGLNELLQDYVNALCTEISNNASCFLLPKTIFFGGGTPTVLSNEQFSQIVKALKSKNIWFGSTQERTCEANPGTVDEKKLEHLLELGFNRLSLGVQSFSDRLLQNIGRIHNSKQAIATIKMAQKVGWQNISVDLMYGLPGQSLEDLQTSLKQAISLGVQHISAYNLIVEEDTVLEKMLENQDVFLPEESIENAMYDWVNAYLPEKGYKRYEISNYSLVGYTSKHNAQYWRYLPYKGFGAAACSFTGYERLTNVYDVQEYINKIKNNLIYYEQEDISKENLMAEFMFMGLRMVEGISIKDFENRFKEDIINIYGKQMDENIKAGFLLKEKNQINLTQSGMKIGNKIFLTFLP